MRRESERERKNGGECVRMRERERVNERDKMRNITKIHVQKKNNIILKERENKYLQQERNKL